MFVDDQLANYTQVRCAIVSGHGVEDPSSLFTDMSPVWDALPAYDRTKHNFNPGMKDSPSWATNNPGFTVTLPASTSGFYTAYVQARRNVAESGPPQYIIAPLIGSATIILDADIPEVVVSHPIGETATADTRFNISATDPTITGANNAVYQMMVENSADLLGVTLKDGEVPVAANIGVWLPYQEYVWVRLKSKPPSDPNCLITVRVRDLARNVSDITDDSIGSVVYLLEGPAFTYRLIRVDNSEDSVLNGEHITSQGQFKVLITFDNNEIATSVAEIGISCALDGSESVTPVTYRENPFQSTFVSGAINLSQNDTTGKNVLIIDVIDKLSRHNVVNTFVVLDQQYPIKRMVTFDGAITVDNDIVLTSRDCAMRFSCQDRSSVVLKITGDFTNTDTGFINELRPLVSFVEVTGTSTVVLDGQLHAQSTPSDEPIVKQLIEGDDYKTIRIEWMDAVGNRAFNQGDSEQGANIIIKLDTSGGVAPIKLQAVGLFPDNQYNNNHVQLTWTAPSSAPHPIDHYKIYEIDAVSQDVNFNAIWGLEVDDPLLPFGARVYVTTDTIPSFVVENIPDEGVQVPRHYRVTAVLTVTGLESPYSNEAVGVFAENIEVSLNFIRGGDIFPGGEASAAITSPAAVISLPRTLNDLEFNNQITPNDLVAYVGTHAVDEGGNYFAYENGWDLVLRVYAWNPDAINNITKTTGDWMVFYKDLPESATYLIKEGEGLVLEFAGGVAHNVKKIVYVGMPWSVGDFTLRLKKGLNLVGIPRQDFIDPTAMVRDSRVGSDSVLEITAFDEEQQAWQSFVSAIDTYKPTVLDTFKTGFGYFIKASDVKDITFSGAIWNPITE